MVFVLLFDYIAVGDHPSGIDPFAVFYFHIFPGCLIKSYGGSSASAVVEQAVFHKEFLRPDQPQRASALTVAAVIKLAFEH